MMRLWLAICALLLCGVALWIYQAKNEHQAALPRPLLPKPLLQNRISPAYLGIVPANTEVRFPLQLSNQLSSDVRISGAEVSCGCLSFLEKPDAIDSESVGVALLSYTSSIAPGQQSNNAILFGKDVEGEKVFWAAKVIAIGEGIWCDNPKISFGDCEVSGLRTNEWLTLEAPVCEFTIHMAGKIADLQLELQLALLTNSTRTEADRVG